MVCSNCGYALGPDDQFCGGCGAYLTDAPETEPVPTQPHQGDWAVPYAPADPEPPRQSGGTGAIIAGVLVALLVGAVLLFWWTRSNGDESTAAPTTPTTAQTPTDAPTTGSTPLTQSPIESPSPTDTPTDSPTTATPEPIELPGSAEQCASAGGLTVYKGNSATSCPFAENVARAYAAMDPPPEDAVTLTDVASPVTGKNYTLSCTYTAPIRCTGGNNAVIFLARS